LGVTSGAAAALSTSGFTKINLITDTGGPSSGSARLPAQPPAPSSR
jgi:biopolymer transport protein TolR